MKRVIGSKARCLVAIVALAVIGLSSPGLAKADLFSATVWVNTAAASDATVANAPSVATEAATFTTNAINFQLGVGSPQATATLGQWLGSNVGPGNGIDNLMFFNGASNASIFTTSGNITTGSYVLFTGITGLSASGTTSFTATHDDGAELQVAGHTVFSAPGPTSAEVSTGTASGTGNAAFSLAYGEVNGTPAVIEFSPPPAIAPAVPEPSTLAIAGLGALGMIGYGLRRRKAIGA